jgi:hypothetical protein
MIDEIHSATCEKDLKQAGAALSRPLEILQSLEKLFTRSHTNLKSFLNQQSRKKEKDLEKELEKQKAETLNAAEALKKSEKNLVQKGPPKHFTLDWASLASAFPDKKLEEFKYEAADATKPCLLTDCQELACSLVLMCPPEWAGSVPEQREYKSHNFSHTGPYYSPY